MNQEPQQAVSNILKESFEEMKCFSVKQKPAYFDPEVGWIQVDLPKKEQYEPERA